MTNDEKTIETKVYDNKQYEVVEDLIVKGQQMKRVIIWLNIFALILIVAIVVGGSIAMKVIHIELVLAVSWVDFLLMFAAYIIYIFVHEFIHGLAFRMIGRIPWKHITYGVVIKSGMAYCISTVPVSLRASRISLLAPFVVICVPMFVCSLVLGSFALLIACAFFVSGSVGDFWYLRILRGKPNGLYMLEEKPSGGMYQLGCRLVKPLGL